MAVTTRSRSTWLALAGCLLLEGCAAPVQRLSEQRVFDQALCAAEPSRHRDRDLAFVRDRIDREARPRLHLYALPRAELVSSLGEAGARLADRAVVVRAVAAIDAIAVDDFQLRVLLVGPEGPVAPRPLHVETIAAFTGETIPPDQVEHIASRRRFVRSRFRERPLLGLGALTLEAATLFTMPITEATGHTQREPARTIVTEPTDEEIAIAAPAATVLAEAAAQRGHTRDARGETISSAWLWPRPEGDDLRLVIEWSYAAHGCVSRRPAFVRPPTRTAEVVRAIELPLPPGPDLESRIAAAFGEHMRMLVR